MQSISLPSNDKELIAIVPALSDQLIDIEVR